MNTALTVEEKKKARQIFWLSNIVYVVFICFVIIFGILHPQFFSMSNIASLLKQSSVWMLVSTGMALVVLTGGMDMSIGMNMLVSSAVMWLLNSIGLPFALSIVVSILVGIGIGLINGLMATYLPIYPLLPTLATMYVCKGIGCAITGGGNRLVPEQLKGLINTSIGGFPIHIFIAFAVVVVMHIFLSKFEIGRQIYAIGDNPKTAKEKGINDVKIKLIAYILCGVICAFAGLVSTAQVGAVTLSTGEHMELYCVIIPVLGGISLAGGRGNVFPGIILGTLIMTTISNSLVMIGASSNLYNLVYGVVILVVILIDAVKTHLLK